MRRSDGGRRLAKLHLRCYLSPAIQVRSTIRLDLLEIVFRRMCVSCTPHPQSSSSGKRPATRSVVWAPAVGTVCIPSEEPGFPASGVSPCTSPRLRVGGGPGAGARNGPSRPGYQGRRSGVPRRRGCQRRQPARGPDSASEGSRRPCLCDKRIGRADPSAAGSGWQDPHRQDGSGYRSQDAVHVQ